MIAAGSSPTGPAPRTWSADLGSRVVLAIGVFLIGYCLWQIFRWGGDAHQVAIGDLAFVPVNIAATFLALRAARRDGLEYRARRAWLLIGLGLFAYVVGDVLQFVLEMWPTAVPYGSIDDLFYLSFYPLVLAGILQFPRERLNRVKLVRFALDGAIMLVGAGAIVWYVLLAPLAFPGGQRTVDAAISISYPIGDLILILGVTTLSVGRHRTFGGRVLVLFAASLILYIVGDILYGRLAFRDAYSGGDPVDLFWMVSIALIAASANEQYLAGNAPAPTAGRAARPPDFPFLPYVAVAGTFALLIASLDDGSRIVLGAVAFVCTETALVLLRMQWMSLESGRNERRFRALVENVEDNILTVDGAGEVTYMSPSLERVLGHDDTAMLSDNERWTRAIAPHELRTLQVSLSDLASHPGMSRSLETRVCSVSGELRTLSGRATNLLEDSAVLGTVVVFHDITERVALKGELEQQALHDSVTGLPNRALIYDRLRQQLAGTARRLSTVAALLIDLDNFKDVNDNLGHGVGDELLKVVAERLSNVIRETDTVGRFGADEFVVIAEQPEGAESGPLLAERILDVIMEPFELDGAPGKRLTVRASIGIAVGAADSPDDLLRNADSALHRAKAKGKNCFVMFDPEMHALASRRVQLGFDLHDALSKGQFFLEYQPVIALNTLEPYGVEALLRWQHPQRGTISPAEFIPLLEESQHIVDVGKWVLDQACAQGAKWQREGLPLTMSVNVSVLQLMAGSFTGYVRDALASTGLDADHLVIEITETILVQEPGRVTLALEALKALGVRIAIDDFGTGYSSLTYLRQFPIDVLKIDQSFVADIEASKDAATLVRSLVRLGKELGITTTAEGIEEAGQLAALRAESCESGQGYFFARPMPVDGVDQFVETWRRTATTDGTPAL